MSTGLAKSYPRLVADIGGTNARFALETAPGVFEEVEVLACGDYPTLEAAIRAYLGRVDAQVAHAAIGIANPVDGDEVRMTNHHWAFSIEATRQALGLSTLLVLNDFTALALALPGLKADERVQIGGGAGKSGRPLALLGAGTGLGVSGLLPTPGGWVPLAGEGGHASFAPHDERETALLAWAQQQLGGHVSAERFLSGPGLVLIYQGLCALEQAQAEDLGAAGIVERGLSGRCPRCRETLDRFCAMLGGFAANLALTLGAQGGVYIGGGVAPRLLGYLETSPLRARFEAKGRFGAWLREIPLYVITAHCPALSGAAAALEQHLAGGGHA